MTVVSCPDPTLYEEARTGGARDETATYISAHASYGTLCALRPLANSRMSKLDLPGAIIMEGLYYNYNENTKILHSTIKLLFCEGLKEYTK